MGIDNSVARADVLHDDRDRRGEAVFLFMTVLLCSRLTHTHTHTHTHSLTSHVCFYIIVVVNVK